MILTDKMLHTFETNLTRMILNENTRQLMKWGVQSHSIFEWLAYTTEELGELSKAISEHCYRGESKDEIVKEAIQVATLALKIAEMVHYESPQVPDRISG